MMHGRSAAALGLLALLTVVVVLAPPLWSAHSRRMQPDTHWQYTGDGAVDITAAQAAQLYYQEEWDLDRWNGANTTTLDRSRPLRVLQSFSGELPEELLRLVQESETISYSEKTLVVLYDGKPVALKLCWVAFRQNDTTLTLFYEDKTALLIALTYLTSYTGSYDNAVVDGAPPYDEELTALIRQYYEKQLHLSPGQYEIYGDSKLISSITGEISVYRNFALRCASDVEKDALDKNESAF